MYQSIPAAPNLNIYKTFHKIYFKSALLIYVNIFTSILKLQTGACRRGVKS